MEGNPVDQFSSHLFWDVSRQSIDCFHDKSFIIKRVLEYGTWNDWKISLAIYGLKEIVNTAREFRDLDPKSLSFLSNLTSTPLNQFRCYITRQSMPKHATF